MSLTTIRRSDHSQPNIQLVQSKAAGFIRTLHPRPILCQQRTEHETKASTGHCIRDMRTASTLESRTMDGMNIQYAEARDWNDIMKNRSKLKMHELIERLGLRAKWSSNKRGKTNFDSALVKDFVSDMSNVVHTLPKETNVLIARLATRDSLKNEIDHLLDKHGSAIWGRAGNREHLVSVGEADVEQFYYPRDLCFEEEEDRELIRMLLHWWIGLKACNVLLSRERLDRERRKKEERLRLREDETCPRQPKPTIPIAPAVHPDSTPQIPYSQPPRHVQALRLDICYSNSVSPLSGTPLHSNNDSPILPGYDATKEMGGSRHARALADITVPQHTRPWVPTLQQLGSELGTLVSNFLEDGRTATARHTPSPKPDQTAPADGDMMLQHLDLETLCAFRSYIYPGESGPKWDEATLLRRVETVWRDQVRTGHSRNLPLFAGRDGAFLTWIELRRHLADLNRADEEWRQEGDQVVDLEARVAQHQTLMSASRDLVRSWEDMELSLVADGAPAGLTADYLLVEAFELLAGESGTEDMIWTPMKVKETVRWLSGHLEHFAAETGDEEGLIYVRT